MKAEAAYWIQKRLDEGLERQSNGLPVSQLPRSMAGDTSLLSTNVNDLIPSDSEDTDFVSVKAE